MPASSPLSAIPKVPATEAADDASAIRAEAARIQSSGVLGETRLRQLFDYLVANSAAGQSPKEIAIAIDVFGKNASFDVSQDALVRVYIHKLRKALDDFYASPAAGPPGRALHIPRGEYRLKLSAATPAAGPGRTRRSGSNKILIAIAVVLGAALLGYALALLRTPHSDLDQVRANPIWSAILKDDRPIMIIVGDYYLIGETDASMEVKRLVREFSVNSKSDLDRYVAQHPEVADRYMDVGERYLPIAAASALRDVVAVLAPENRRIVVSKMSDIEASSLKSADIVYIGYISGSRLVYSMPEAAALGVHLTLDLGGQARFGPDVEWIAAPDYEVDAQRAPQFYSAIRRYWPALADGALRPGYAGVRPKLSCEGAPAADFDIQGPSVHGVPGLVNLYGIESPGLTASLAIAEHVAALV